LRISMMSSPPWVCPEGVVSCASIASVLNFNRLPPAGWGDWLQIGDVVRLRLVNLGGNASFWVPYGIEGDDTALQPPSSGQESP